MKTPRRQASGPLASFAAPFRRFTPMVAGTLWLALGPRAGAQLQWNVFNETTTTAAPAASATSGVAITVPPGQRATLVATNFVPIDLTNAGTEAQVTISFKVSGGLSTIGSGTRAIGFGLFNHNGTATNYADDGGYFTWLNGRATGSLIEQRRRFGDGSSPSLLNATGTAVANESTGSLAVTPGVLNDGNVYAIQLHLMGRSGSVSFGNTASASNIPGSGVWVSGPGISQVTFSNPDTPAAAFVFNEIGFMFFNSTSSPQTLTIVSVSSPTNTFLPINAPAIAQQPAAISLNPGQAGTLSVVSTGTPPLAYQWRKDGTTITGATAATYTIPSAAAADAGSYSVAITNAYGNVTSSAAAVTITSAQIPATINSQPASVTVNVGDNASFAVGAFGSSPVTYQWRKDGAAIAGATGSALSLTKVAAADAGSYTVVVTAGGGTATTATSAAATLSVNTAPAITTQPASVTTSVGQNVSFSVAATGSPTPLFQWFRNGAPISGATSATLTINNVQLSNTGAYSVSLINDVGAVTSATAVLAIPSTMTVASTAPAAGATVNVDAPLSLTFDRPPVVGSTGRIRIFKAADDSVVDTLDLGSNLQQRTVGTNATLYNFIPVAISGNTATFYMHAGVLAYGQAYYVQIEPSAILDATGASFMGITDKTTWRFTAKASGPAANATALTVAADGSGDFNTVQGAIDAVPAGNNQRVVITVKKGNYNELVYIGATRPFVTIRGEDRAQTIVGYQNNNNLNSTTATRAAFSIAASDSVLENITIKNPTPQGGSQAEAVFTGALRVMLNRVNLLSRQDTLLTNTGTAFITDSYIEGNTDFMWGTAAAYFSHCELKALDTGASTQGFYTQVRNPATGYGNVYVDCKLTAADGVIGKSTYYLGRIDPSPGNFPFSQCIYLNCAMGAHIDPAGWLLGTNNNVTSSTVQYWEYKSTDLAGATLDVSKRISSSRQLTEAEAALWRNPAFVLGWTPPTIAAAIDSTTGSQAMNVGSTVRFSVVAQGFPVPALQWFKNGVAIQGATRDTLTLPNVQAADAANYSVIATNLGGTVTGAAATLTLTRGPYVGAYFGTVGTGSFALYVRDNGSGVMLASGAGAAGTFAARGLSVDPNGRLRGAAGAFAIDGTIDANGNVSGSVGPAPGSGIAAPSATLSGTRSNPGGPAQNYAGYYQAGVNGASTTANLIVGGGGQAFALVQTGATLEAAAATVDPSGALSVKLPSGATVATTLAANASAATLTLTPATGAASTLAGAIDTSAAAQRVREFSARARVDATNAAMVGFVVAGDSPGDVLLRAVGPTLSDAFAVAGALPNPRIDVYRGSTVIASNVGWASNGGGSDVALAAAQAGAFPLRTNVADSAVRVSLAPGAYTAVMSSAGGGTSGVGLMEVFDVSNGAGGQRLTNLSARGTVGIGVNSLITGVIVAGTQPKRLLIRGVGPALGNFGVSGALTRPWLLLYRGTTLVAQNTGWSTTADAAAITSAAVEAGAFPFAANSADAAILINLAPGVYTAQLTSVDAVTGAGLIEVYELP